MFEKPKIKGKCEECSIRIINHGKLKDKFSKFKEKKMRNKRVKNYQRKGISVAELTGKTNKEKIYLKNKTVIEKELKEFEFFRDEKIKISNRKSFEIFGIDLMLDESLKLWLIEVNTNPSLDETNQFLQALIPRMLDDALKLTIDQQFKPPFGQVRLSPKSKTFSENNLIEANNSKFVKSKVSVDKRKEVPTNSIGSFKIEPNSQNNFESEVNFNEGTTLLQNQVYEMKRNYYEKTYPIDKYSDQENIWQLISLL
jgi:hypothetical protein